MHIIPIRISQPLQENVLVLRESAITGISLNLPYLSDVIYIVPSLLYHSVRRMSALNSQQIF